MMAQLSRPGQIEKLMAADATRAEMEEQKTFKDEKETRKCDAGSSSCSKMVFVLIHSRTVFNSPLPGVLDNNNTKNDSKCRVYCSPECQRNSWIGDHKKECKQLKACAAASDLALNTPVPDELQTKIGLARTKHHGTYAFCMESYQYSGHESNRLVPISSIKIHDQSSNGIPTNQELVKCLINAILHPDFDTVCAGMRRPHKLCILSSTIANQDTAERVAAVATRLGCKVQIPDENDTLEDGSWEFSWFCVQMGWNDEVSDSLFLQMVERNRFHPMKLNGLTRKVMTRKVDEWNERAAKVPAESFPTLQDIVKLPFSKDFDNVMHFAIYEGILYVWTKQLLYHRPIMLHGVNGRPQIEDVLGPLYKACIKEGKRPCRIIIGQPSICSLEDVTPYELALDDTVCSGMAIMAQSHNLEGVLEDFIPYWRRSGDLND
eukprot:scaffold57597_cov55-Attheya_sp.AAC.1